MNALYGPTLLAHPVFSKTHADFLRQLVAHTHLQVYLPGQYIAEKGDVDQSMYFVLSGEVIVYDKHGNNEIEQMVITKGGAFGDAQGIGGIPHDRSYKARFVCELLILVRDEWSYLMDWFPASREFIFEQLKV